MLNRDKNHLRAISVTYPPRSRFRKSRHSQEARLTRGRQNRPPLNASCRRGPAMIVGVTLDESCVGQEPLPSFRSMPIPWASFL